MNGSRVAVADTRMAFWLRAKGMKHKLFVLYFLMFLLPVAYFLYLILQLQLRVDPASFFFTRLSLLIGIPAAIVMSVSAFILMYRSVGSIETATHAAESFIHHIHPLAPHPVETADEAEKISRYVSDMISELKEKFTDIDRYAEELNSANRKLMDLAIHDGLTGLFNHKQMKYSLAMETERASRFRHPLSILILDLDNFKGFNDTHGHPVGDRALREIAQILKTSIRKVDIPARYGGDEFLIILPETARAEAYAIAERLRVTVFNHPFPVNADGLTGHMTISVGIGELINESLSSTDLLSRADACLYEAKQSGRNRACA